MMPGIRPTRSYQLRISLLGVEPPVWRRVRVPAEIGLVALHRVIQEALGWPDLHYHVFSTESAAYGTPDEDMPFEVKPEWAYTLADLRLCPEDRITYEYDFGDGWAHDVVVERIDPLRKSSPLLICLGGERACPPDGVVARGGYDVFLAAIADPAHRRHQEMLNWAGGAFDPERFDIAEANARLRALAESW